MTLRQDALRSIAYEPNGCALIALLVSCDACPGQWNELKGPMAVCSLQMKHINLSVKHFVTNLKAEISSMRGVIVNGRAASLCLAKSFLYETTQWIR